MGTHAMAHFNRQAKERAARTDEYGVLHSTICPIVKGGMYCECRSAEEIEGVSTKDWKAADERAAEDALEGISTKEFTHIKSEAEGSAKLAAIIEERMTEAGY